MAMYRKCLSRPNSELSHGRGFPPLTYTQAMLRLHTSTHLR